MNQKLKTLLWISLALNILLVGGVLGYLTGQRRQTSHRPPHEMPPLPSGAAGLSQDHEKDFHRMMEGVRERSEELSERLEAAREDVFNALIAEPFNPALYQQKVEVLHNLNGERVKILSKAVQDFAGGLSKDERAVLAQRLRRGPPGPEHRPEFGGERRPPPREPNFRPEHGFDDQRRPPPPD